MKLHPNQKYDIDSNFFNVIDTEEKAYILGFLYADGCLSKNAIIFRLSSIDIDILEKIKKAMKYDGPIYIGKPLKYISTNNKPINIKEQSILQISHVPIANALRKIGVTERKSKTATYPLGLPLHLHRHFIRGYFDGDGGLHISKQCLCLRCCIVGTSPFLQSIQQILNDNGISPSNLSLHNGMYYLRIGKYWNIKKFYTFLYTNSTIYLNRKRELFDTYFNNIPEKRKIGSSKYKGVFYNKYDNNWTVIFKKQRIGSSKDEDTAYKIYKEHESKWLIKDIKFL